MSSNEHNNRDKRPKKKTQNPESNTIDIDFGTRKISDQNSSKILAVPKGALTNCGCNLEEEVRMEVHLIQTDQEKFIKLIPKCGTKTPEKKRKEVKD